MAFKQEMRISPLVLGQKDSEHEKTHSSQECLSALKCTSSSFVDNSVTLSVVLESVLFFCFLGA